MEFNKKEDVLYLDRDRFDFFDSGSGRILTFPFQPNAISSLDIVNQQELENQIKVFIDQFKISPANLVIILSQNVLFEKDFVKIPIEEQTPAIEKFLDVVPFDSLATKLIPIHDGVRISAVNKALCDGISLSLEKVGFTTEGIVPYEELQPEIAQATALDGPTLSVILKKLDSIKSFSFAVSSKIPNKTKTNSPTQPSTKKITTDMPSKGRIILLGGVFLVLIIVLVFVIINQQP